MSEMEGMVFDGKYELRHQLYSEAKSLSRSPVLVS